MKTYTDQEIKDYKAYLSDCVEEGYLDEDVAVILVTNGLWEDVQKLMDRADSYANAND